MHPTTYHNFLLAIFITSSVQSLWRSSISLGLISRFWFPMTLGIYYIVWNCDQHYSGSCIFAVFTIFFFLILLFLIMLLAEAEGTLTRDIRYRSGDKRTALPRSRVAFLPGSKWVLPKTWREKFALRNECTNIAGKTKPEQNSGGIVVLNDGYSLTHFQGLTHITVCAFGH